MASGLRTRPRFGAGAPFSVRLDRPVILMRRACVFLYLPKY